MWVSVCRSLNILFILLLELKSVGRSLRDSFRWRLKIDDEATIWSYVEEETLRMKRWVVYVEDRKIQGPRGGRGGGGGSTGSFIGAILVRQSRSGSLRPLQRRPAVSMKRLA